MAKIIFPKNNKNKRYYTIHADFFFKWASFANHEILFEESNDKIWFHTVLAFLFNGKQVMIDHSDHPHLPDIYYSHTHVPYFKCHYLKEEHGNKPNIKPLGPTLITPATHENYKQYFNMMENGNYNPYEINYIACKQRAYAGARDRRRNVHSMLSNRFGNMFDGNAIDKQLQFWDKTLNSLVSVCVPGARPDMLDRGHLEALGLGVCTISPRITTPLTYNRELIPGEHYVECHLDYSDLIAKVEWCQKNRDECKRIGDNAKALFREIYYPDKYWKWIEQNI